MVDLSFIVCMHKIYLSGEGFEPSHSKVAGLKPAALDHSANLTRVHSKLKITIKKCSLGCRL